MKRELKGRVLLASVLSVVVLLAALATPAEAANGTVLPATAKAAGWSLERALQDTAYFNTSILDWNTGYRDPGRLPEDLPFEILYLTPGNSFEAKAGTTFYLPITYIDSTPPLIGTYPTTTADARHYFFDPSQFGITDITVVIDGEAIPIGPEYLAGPVSTTLGYDFVDPTEVFQYAGVGAFLKLPKGEHTITISYTTGGTLFLNYLASLGLPAEPSYSAFGYTVTVR